MTFNDIDELVHHQFQDSMGEPNGKLNYFGRNSKVTLQWVSSHAGEQGCEETDILARTGASTLHQLTEFLTRPCTLR